MKKSWVPPTDQGKCEWFDNGGPKLPDYAAILDITPSELAGFAADRLAWLYTCQSSTAMDQFGKDWTAYKKLLRSGQGDVSEMPVLPTLGTPPPAVAPGIWVRVPKFMSRLKKHANFTDPIGENLWIIGADTVLDLNAMKPSLKLVLQAGHPNVIWLKKGMSGLEIWVDRGNGVFVFLAMDTEPDYLDTAPLPAAGTSAVWRYKAIYRFHDEQVGQWSDIASISVMG